MNLGTNDVSCGDCYLQDAVDMPSGKSTTITKGVRGFSAMQDTRSGLFSMFGYAKGCRVPQSYAYMLIWSCTSTYT